MKDKAPIKNISLSFICDKDWNNMLPCSSGRHCSDCDKTVIDFTNKNVEDLLTALESKQQVCGRFHKSQLSQFPRQKPFYLKRVAASLFLALGFSAFSRVLQAQTLVCTDTAHNHNSQQSEQLFGVIMETAPVYKHGGESGMLDFINNNLRYPATESINGIVAVAFIVDTTGQVTDPQIIKGLSVDANKEALRIVKLLEFYPGTHEGKKVPVRYTLPIKFSDDRRKKE